MLWLQNSKKTKEQNPSSSSKTEILFFMELRQETVIPSENTDLLIKKYKCSGQNMEDTWRSFLINPSKYLIVTPQKIRDSIDKVKYADLISYLKIRY